MEYKKVLHPISKKRIIKIENHEKDSIFFKHYITISK